jgi:protein ImuB
MFACIYGQLFPTNSPNDNAKQALLIDLAFTFSPLVERTSVDTVVLDVSGDELLFSSQKQHDVNWTRRLGGEIARRAVESGLKVNVSVAANPDVAIHAARSFKGVTVVSDEAEFAQLGNLSIKLLDYSLAGIDEKKAEEMGETLTLWGIRTFFDFAKLPLAGVAQRLGQQGVRLQKLAQGKSERQLVLIQPPVGFEQSIELEHPITELEPLSFILSRLLNQLCANLHANALATNELRLRLVTESETTVDGSYTAGSDPATSERTIALPVPMRNPKTLLRLLLFDIEARPPQAAITAVTIAAEPVKPRISQTGLFIPLAPEPEKLEVTLARLAKLVGADKVGSPEILDTYRPDAFRMKRFSITGTRKQKRSHLPSLIHDPQFVMGFRIFRPSWRAQVQTVCGAPVRIAARNLDASGVVQGKITCASGPWRSSGDWWRPDAWARDEWDVVVEDRKGRQGEMLCRIYCHLGSDEWFMEGVYD